MTEYCPIGLVLVSEPEINIAAEVLQRKSCFIISEQAARNLAYSVLIALRGSHFEWKRENE